MRRFRIHRQGDGLWLVVDRRHQFCPVLYGNGEPRSYWWVAGRRRRIERAVKAAATMEDDQ